MRTELTANSMGSRAVQSLAASRDATIRGVTSRGVYLQTSPHSVVFLTRDPTHGPFTVSVGAFPGEFTRLAPGDPVRVQDGHIDLTSEDISISTLDTQIWNPPLPPANRLSGSGQLIYLKQLVRTVLETKGWVGLASLLFDLLQVTGSPPPEADPLELKETVDGCLQALIAGDERAVLQHLLHALGRGPGLTPSGDDLSVGILLALRRGGPPNFSSEQVDWLAKAITASAYEKTTTYSANLIDAAGSGEADERLLAACDGVITGTPAPETAAKGIAHWGSSSGVDTLTGIALVCLAAPAADLSRR